MKVATATGIRDALPTRMALPTGIAPSHYQPVLPWYYTVLSWRYHPICGPGTPNSARFTRCITGLQVRHVTLFYFWNRTLIAMLVTGSLLRNIHGGGRKFDGNFGRKRKIHFSFGEETVIIEYQRTAYFESF